MNSVNVKREKQVIPTYVPRKPIELPMFFEHKPYQGASGRLYPLPFSDSISDEKEDVEYDIFTLQNEYIMTQVAPELGGKILRGYDKTGAYDFIYYNEVVKPALVGLAGPWISGGIEFNYPQHHRPTTYMQLEAYAEEGADGSKTVWVGEVEPFNRMKGMAGITVDTGRSYIKAKIRVYNRTEQPQVFMWWANLAVPVNETYKTIFPPDVEWVNDHDRRCVMSWPIAKGVYQTARPFDYGEGTDISMYDAIRVPSSFLVSQGQSDQDFVAGYDGGKQKGIVTVADHHIAPGKKMWHWGKGDFGDMWCSNLTDENGPYIELMTGVYTDNQPDFTWIAPYETKEFEQYWYPIHDIGDVKNATIDAAVNVEKRGSNLFLGFNVTGTFKNAVVTVCQKGTCFFTETVDLTPDKAYLKELTSKMVENRECLEEQTMEMAPDMQLDKIAVNVLTPDWKLEDITVSLTAEDGTVLVDYETYIRGQKEPITPRKPVKRPCEIESVEELYINGLHLEQYKQHNYSAADYYKEGLQRDPADTRCNTAMARLAFRNGNFAECISYADKAMERLTSRNEHSPSVEALYLKGMALKYLGENQKAYDVFFRASWDYSYRSASYFALAQLDCAKGAYEEALKKLDISLSLNTGHSKALILKAAIYRRMGEEQKTKEMLEQILNFDKLDMAARVEKAAMEAELLANVTAGAPENAAAEVTENVAAGVQTKVAEMAADIHAMFGSKSENYVDVAADYINAGLYAEALFTISLAQESYPLLDYYAAYCKEMLGETDAACALCKKAESQEEAYCFPSRIDDIRVLEKAMSLNPQGEGAYYYLGCLHYDRFNYDKAIKLWETAIVCNPNYGKAFRNLALAYFDKKQDYMGAKVCMEKAMENLPNEPRLLMEYQQLLKNMDYSPETRLSVYDTYNDLMLLRDDCYLDKLTLKCMVGEYQEAINMAKQRRFHIYEGGEGKLTKQHAWMHVLYGNELAAAGNYEGAEAAYKAGVDMPKSYGEAKTFFNQEAHIFYFLGLLCEKQEKNAEECYQKAAVYKAAVSEISLFRALAYRKLMKFREAKEVLDEMLRTADGFLNDCDRRTYYGVGSPSPMPFEDNIVINNLMSGYTLKAYALLGLGRFNEADAMIAKAKEIFKYDFRVYTYEQIRNYV